MGVEKGRDAPACPVRWGQAMKGVARWNAHVARMAATMAYWRSFSRVFGRARSSVVSLEKKARAALVAKTAVQRSPWEAIE